MEWNHVAVALLPSLRSQARGVCVRDTETGVITQWSHFPNSQNCYSKCTLLSILYLQSQFLIWDLPTFDSYFLLLKTFTSSYILKLCQFYCLCGWMLSLKNCASELVWSHWLAFCIHEEVVKFLFQGFWHVSMWKSRLPRCLAPVSSFWSWYVQFSLWLLTCCH